MERMNAATLHRGPDGSRTWSDGSVSFGFNRLAIIDLSERAMQPMHSADLRYTIIFNGEIYNYKELKQELAAYPYTSESDTEVILAAYSAWGDAAFSRLNGMYALALWDGQEKRLVLARDPVGIKPLYYSFDGRRLVFSSELKGVLEAGVSRTLDRVAFSHYLRLLYVPGEMTMFSEIQKVPAGHMVVFQNNQGQVMEVPHPWPDEAPPQSYPDAVAAVRARVTNAVTRQLVSDRPIGVYLSGGIDSTSVLAAASTTHPKINTYSVGFDLTDDEEQEKFNRDAELAALSAKHFGATHHEFRLTSGEVSNLFPEMIHFMDEPVANATTLPQLFLARETKSTATVVLTGDGGDELFGGYERYRLALLAEQYGGYIPRALLVMLPPSLRSLHLKGVDRYAQLMFQPGEALLPPLTGLPVAETKKLFIRYFQKGDIAGNLMRADEENWLRDEALLRSDTMGMGASVEVRVPLLDLEVRSLAHSLPTEWKVTRSKTKRILKDAFKDVLPPEVLTQPKRGWFSPGAKWLRRNEFVALTDEVFANNYTDASKLFNLNEVRRLATAHREKRAYHYTPLWATLVFLSWAREYKATL